MFQQCCSLVVGQFISKGERLLHRLLILKKVQTQHSTAARDLISVLNLGLLRGVVRVLVCWVEDLQRSTFLGGTSPRHGDQETVYPAFSVTDLSLNCFPACCIEDLSGISEVPDSVPALCRPLANYMEL